MQRVEFIVVSILRFLFAFCFALVPLLLVNPYDRRSFMGILVTIVPAVLLAGWVTWRSAKNQ
jgi:hypothetical protein